LISNLPLGLVKLEPVLANIPIAPLFVEEALAFTVISPLLIKLPVSFVKTPIEPSATAVIFPRFSPTPVPDIKAPIFSPFSIFTSPSLSLITFALSVNKPMFESFSVFRLDKSFSILNGYDIEIITKENDKIFEILGIDTNIDVNGD